MEVITYCSTDGDCTQFKAEGDAGKFSGYAATWDKDNHGEQFVRGAFLDSLADWNKKGRYPSLYLDHPQMRGESAIPIGVIKFLSEDATGLRIEGEINLHTTAGREAWALVKQGALRSLSVGFRVDSDGVRWNAARQVLEITKASLFEVSIVDQPANDAARILEIKSRLNSGDLITVRDLERIFKEIGFTRGESKKLCACAKHVHKPDDESEQRDAETLEAFTMTVKAAIADWREANRQAQRHLQFNL